MVVLIPLKELAQLLLGHLPLFSGLLQLLHLYLPLHLPHLMRMIKLIKNLPLPSLAYSTNKLIPIEISLGLVYYWLECAVL